VAREFRGIWVATVNNIDWPSRPGLSTWEQQQELLAILNRAVSLKINAIVFHVRPSADALFESTLEPWSQYLSGRQGRGPEPQWDPLTFAIAESHRRGLELHAWFNPYRAHFSRDSAGAANTHVMRTRPELVRHYGGFIWMDPGDPEVRRRAVRAIVDVVKRYDVDGVHIDDYFYPYPENDSAGRRIDFPDSATYTRYRRTGGQLDRNDWRRRNVDLMVEAMFKGVRAAKPWVKVGISPFGIWRPGNPPQIRGFDAYAEIYADSKKWLQSGWLDYLAPQLYWPINRPEQSYPVLLDGWVKENTKQRHIWPGLATYRISDTTPARHIPSDEITEEIKLTRAQPGATGHIHFNTRVIMRSPDSLNAKLSRVYEEPALIPASPWLGGKKPGRPIVALRTDAATGDRLVSLTPAKGESVWLWTVRTQANGTWQTEIIPGWQRRHRLPSADADRVLVSAVSRTGMESATIELVR
jgi:uncharacterized lipoprotein YddW (UPF0748 family)